MRRVSVKVSGVDAFVGDRLAIKWRYFNRGKGVVERPLTCMQGVDEDIPTQVGCVGAMRSLYMDV